MLTRELFIPPEGCDCVTGFSPSDPARLRSHLERLRLSQASTTDCLLFIFIILLLLLLLLLS